MKPSVPLMAYRQPQFKAQFTFTCTNLHTQVHTHTAYTHSCTHTASLLPLDSLACCVCAPLPQTSLSPLCSWTD